MTILEDYRVAGHLTCDYLYTDLKMMIETDLEEIRTMSPKLSMSGLSNNIKPKYKRTVYKAYAQVMEENL